MSSSCGGGLECNICLDVVQEPVVTMCGHLYCWPCIYKWIIIHSQINNNNSVPPAAACCPVCKSEILLETSLVPLYGTRGQTRKLLSDDAKLHIPQRPPSPICLGRFEQYYSHNHQSLISSSTSFVGEASSSTSTNTDLTLADAVFAKIFGNSGDRHPNSYNHITGDASNSSPSRLVETDQSLTRVCSFLCCFILGCLVLF